MKPGLRNFVSWPNQVIMALNTVPRGARQREIGPQTSQLRVAYPDYMERFLNTDKQESNIMLVHGSFPWFRLKIVDKRKPNQLIDFRFYIVI